MYLHQGSVLQLHFISQFPNPSAGAWMRCYVRQSLSSAFNFLFRVGSFSERCPIKRRWLEKHYSDKGILVLWKVVPAFHWRILKNPFIPNSAHFILDLEQSAHGHFFHHSLVNFSTDSDSPFRFGRTCHASCHKLSWPYLWRDDLWNRGWHVPSAPPLLHSCW